MKYFDNDGNPLEWSDIDGKGLVAVTGEVGGDYFIFHQSPTPAPKPKSSSQLRREILNALRAPKNTPS